MTELNTNGPCSFPTQSGCVREKCLAACRLVVFFEVSPFFFLGGEEMHYYLDDAPSIKELDGNA